MTNRKDKKQHSHREVLSVRYDTKEPPLETKALRESLKRFLNETPVLTVDGKTYESKIGDYRWGIYAFYDYEGEPIYVGQTNEKLRTRIRRHLTNQRTDAVAMNVLDPFEVCYIEVWPLPEYQAKDIVDAKARLDALEFAVFEEAIRNSKFNAILNEKVPPKPKNIPRLPPSFRKAIVEKHIEQVRGHPDVRIARRAHILSRLAQVISERKVQPGLRKTLLTQAKRLAWLAEQRYSELMKAGALVEEIDETNGEDTD